MPCIRVNWKGYQKVFVYFLPAIEQRFINAGGSQKPDNLKTKEPSYTLCYIELERAATYSGHHFLRFQKCLNGAYAALNR